MAEEPEDFTDEDREQLRDMTAMAKMAFEGPAPFANRFYLSRHAGVFRISFGDQHFLGTDPHFRSAVSLAEPDAVELAKVLGRLLGLTVLGSVDEVDSQII